MTQSAPVQDEYAEGCDYFIHDLYNYAGMFCPCVPQELIDDHYRYMREHLVRR
jgi:hypothetical protein